MKNTIAKFKKMLVFPVLTIAMLGCNKSKIANLPAPLENEYLTTTVMTFKNLNVPSDQPMVAWGQVPPVIDSVLTAGNMGAFTGFNTLAKLLAPDTSIKTGSRLDTLRLTKNSVYSCQILIFDQTKNPVDTVSDVIKQRENIHLFFFFPSSSLTYTPTYNFGLRDSITDRDGNNPPLPIGLQTKWWTYGPAKGTLKVILRHQPNVKNGTYAPGSTDLDVTYPVSIQ